MPLRILDRKLEHDGMLGSEVLYVSLLHASLYELQASHRLSKGRLLFNFDDFDDYDRVSRRGNVSLCQCRERLVH